MAETTITYEQALKLVDNNSKLSEDLFRNIKDSSSFKKCLKKFFENNKNIKEEEKIKYLFIFYIIYYFAKKKKQKEDKEKILNRIHKIDQNLYDKLNKNNCFENCITILKDCVFDKKNFEIKSEYNSVGIISRFFPYINTMYCIKDIKTATIFIESIKNNDKNNFIGCLFPILDIKQSDENKKINTIKKACNFFMEEDLDSEYEKLIKDETFNSENNKQCIYMCIYNMLYNINKIEKNTLNEEWKTFIENLLKIKDVNLCDILNFNQQGKSIFLQIIEFFDNFYDKEDLKKFLKEKGYLISYETMFIPHNASSESKLIYKDDKFHMKSNEKIEEKEYNDITTKYVDGRPINNFISLIGLSNPDNLDNVLKDFVCKYLKCFRNDVITEYLNSKKTLLDYYPCLFGYVVGTTNYFFLEEMKINSIIEETISNFIEYKIYCKDSNYFSDNKKPELYVKNYKNQVQNETQNKEIKPIKQESKINNYEINNNKIEDLKNSLGYLHKRGFSECPNSNPIYCFTPIYSKPKIESKKVDNNIITLTAKSKQIKENENLIKKEDIIINNEKKEIKSTFINPKEEQKENKKATISTKQTEKPEINTLLSESKEIDESAKNLKKDIVTQQQVAKEKEKQDANKTIKDITTNTLQKPKTAGKGISERINNLNGCGIQGNFGRCSIVIKKNNNKKIKSIKELSNSIGQADSEITDKLINNQPQKGNGKK